ncbi:LysR family substrate-binding domain-containing protein [Agrobacterium tumefaciens]|uniref:LysR family substrate-binding domain-containing protein n=1 Tax=Agrobacterium tumefaciens TaxID=358 RepID=UPI0021CF9519|nr:LysR family substrate-binding domain-containing protein [Agrobacterium tumefaciens]UXS01930.1 LysR family substrate-binding domain-containing protein [Agrobacterium tumefaciens]
MHSQYPIDSIRIAISFGAFTAPLAELLAKQRAEEPRTEICLLETSFSEQVQGVAEGRYDLGFAIAPPANANLDSEALWHDEIAVAVPELSPLLAFEEITLEEVVRYPLVLWSAEDCEPLSRRVIELLNSATVKFNVIDRARSFELMAVLVAAGYGIGFAGKSRIDKARKLGIVMRPLAGSPNDLSTYLLRTHDMSSSPIERLIERARKLDQSVSFN